MKPKPPLPWGKRPMRPGRGLGNILRDEPDEPDVSDEAITTKLPVIPEEERVKCPVCKGATIVDFESILGGKSTRKFGVWALTKCTECVDGKVTRKEAVIIRAKLAAKTVEMPKVKPDK